MGLPNSPSTMTRINSMVVSDLEGVIAYLDDILVTGHDLDSCNKNLEAVFEKLKDYGLTISPEKCHFFKPEVVYLGHKMTSNGIMPDPAKVKAIKDFVEPKTLKDMRAFLGLSSYYHKFIKEYAYMRIQPNNKIYN